MGFGNKSVVSALDFSKHELLEVFARAEEFKNGRKQEIGRTIALMFFEPSTRTFASFDAAAKNLGCKTIGFDAAEGTSTKKGESLLDTARMFVGYGADAIVIRHPSAGAAKYLSERLGIPVLNAGDDSHEHPTQAMLDVFTIRERFGKLDGLRVGIMGDLRFGRTASSLSYALSNWQTELFFIAPDVLQIDMRNDRMEERLQDLGTRFTKTRSLGKVLPKLDVLYMTRIQRERFPDETEYNRVKGIYRFGIEELGKAKSSLAVMHPLPRVNELAPEIDSTKNALYFQQASNGMYVRMALLSLILGD